MGRGPHSRPRHESRTRGAGISPQGLELPQAIAFWDGAKHPSPRRQVAFCLAGRLRVQAGDGEVREFGAGAIWRMEDVRGSGHTTTVLGEADVRLAIVQLPAELGDPIKGDHA